MNPPKPATQSPGPFSPHLTGSFYKCLGNMSNNILLGSIPRITVLG